jgi:hypothetical protein
MLIESKFYSLSTWNAGGYKEVAEVREVREVRKLTLSFFEGDSNDCN